MKPSTRGPSLRLRRLIRATLRLLFNTLTRVQVEGWEHFPKQGPALVVVNHLSRLDAPLVYALSDRDDLTALVAKKYRRWPPFRWLVEAVGGIWLDRQRPDAQALRAALAHLRQGGLLGIAPEGTRSPTRALQRGKPGAAYLAALAQVPVVPVAVWGTERWLEELLRLRRPHLHVRVGAPFHLPPLPRHDRDAWLEAQTQRLMCRLAALLPPTYRGVYAVGCDTPAEEMP